MLNGKSEGFKLEITIALETDRKSEGFECRQCKQKIDTEPRNFVGEEDLDQSAEEDEDGEYPVCERCGSEIENKYKQWMWEEWDEWERGVGKYSQ